MGLAHARPNYRYVIIAHVSSVVLCENQLKLQVKAISELTVEVIASAKVDLF